MAKLYRTIIQVEVLSDEPLGGIADDLRSIAYHITEGNCSGQIKTVEQEEVSKPRMAELLLSQDSDPEFLLGEHGWKYGLQPGDQVSYYPPGDDVDEGAIRLTIGTIEWTGDDVCRIVSQDGQRIEARIEELG